MSNRKCAVVCGGGPSGLAAAIKLHQLGWQEIHLVERQEDIQSFDRGKAFNYQLDGRGQKMLADIGIGEDTVKTYGVANLKSVFTAYGPDGKAKELTIPFVLKDKQTAYWITRTALLEMIFERLEEVNIDGHIKLMFGQSFESLEVEDGRTVAKISDASGKKISLHPDIVLGCDGLNSNLRASLADQPSLNAVDFTMVSKPSASSSLLYKVIRLPSNIKVNGESVEVTDNLRSYIFNSSYSAFNEKLSLFSLPVARENEPRTANIILPDTHRLWTIDTAKGLRDYLEEGFPQLDMDEVFPPEEIESFLERRAGKFPDPQYSPKVVAQLGESADKTNCVVIGDAAHSFPPDLGLGVNSALEDVYLLGQEIEAQPDNLTEAAKTYEKTRLPESQALTRLVRTVFPHQYRHVPWRFNFSLAKLLAQIGLARISGGLIDEPTFRLSQDERITYTQLERRRIMTDATFYAILVGSIVGLYYLVRLIF